MKSCTWNCGRRTKNMTRICDPCWQNREAIYLERKAREAAAEKNPKRQAAARKGNAARMAKLTPRLTYTATSEAS
jgi:hypothetical protein